MKRVTLLLTFVLSAAVLLQAQGHWSFKATVTKMRMIECTLQRGFMPAMSGSPAQAVRNCPEYTLVSDKVVYVVLGKLTEEFIPLAENMEFLIRKNELIVFSDDEKTKSRFVIQQMMMRADWDRDEARKELATRMMERSVSYETRNPPR
jgi:glucosamine 6-phosphate synthetase-like amidotransferase/phosphosugar isomerase protein